MEFLCQVIKKHVISNVFLAKIPQLACSVHIRRWCPIIATVECLNYCSERKKIRLVAKIIQNNAHILNAFVSKNVTIMGTI